MKRSLVTASDHSADQSFTVCYEFRTEQDPETVFLAVANEQTTMGFHTVTRQQVGLSQFQAKVESLEIKSRDDHGYYGEATLSFPYANISVEGNPLDDILCFAIGETRHVSGIQKLRVRDIKLPDAAFKSLPGPQFGVAGIRKLLNVSERPLLMGPLRPEVGMSPQQYAQITYEALVGGADIVKDDELLSDPPYCRLDIRCRMCAKAARKAEDQTGERKLYIANIGADLTRTVEQLRIAEAEGADGVMVHPRLTPSLISLVRKHTHIPIVAHYDSLPTFTTSIDEGIRLALLLAFFRISGADVITFPRPNPRFAVEWTSYLDCFGNCHSPELGVESAFPAATGGNTASSVGEAFSILGNLDFIFVAGSALFERGDKVEYGAKELRSALLSLSQLAK